MPVPVQYQGQYQVSEADGDVHTYCKAITWTNGVGQPRRSNATSLYDCTTELHACCHLYALDYPSTAVCSLQSSTAGPLPLPLPLPCHPLPNPGPSRDPTGGETAPGWPSRPSRPSSLPRPRGWRMAPATGWSPDLSAGRAPRAGGDTALSTYEYSVVSLVVGRRRSF